MLALKDYGSSDEGSEPENIDFTSTFPSNKFTNLQICSAPEVVPTVSIHTPVQPAFSIDIFEVMSNPIIATLQMFFLMKKRWLITY